MAGVGLVETKTRSTPCRLGPDPGPLTPSRVGADPRGGIGSQSIGQFIPQNRLAVEIVERSQKRHPIGSALARRPTATVRAGWIQAKPIVNPDE